MKKIFIIVALVAGLMVSAQVKIGDNVGSINANSILELESTTKGVLFPRVTLTGTTDATTVGTQVAGMTVYNTATTSDVTPGMYTSNGTIWARLGGSGSYAKVRTLDTTNSGATGFDLTTYLLSTDEVLILSKTTGHTILMPDPSGANNGRILYLINNSTAAGGAGLGLPTQ